MTAETVRTLLEGLRAGDLAAHVGPVVHVDMHAPRVDPDAIVLDFECRTSDVAFDLARFVFLGPVATLDVDFTDVPDSNLRFHVYVELARNVALAEDLPRLFTDIERLTGTRSWTIRGPGGSVWNDPRDAAAALVASDGNHEETRLRDIAESTGLRTPEGRTVRIGWREWRIVAAGPAHVLVEAIEKTGEKLQIDETSLVESMRISAVTGCSSADRYGPWMVVCRGDTAVILAEE